VTLPQSDSLPMWQQRVLRQRDFHHTSPLSVDACRQALASAVEQDNPSGGPFDKHSQQIDFAPDAGGVTQFLLVRKRRSRGVDYATAIVVGTLAATDGGTTVSGHMRQGGSYTALIGVLVILAAIIIGVALNSPDAITLVLGVGSVIAIGLTLRFVVVDRQWAVQILESALQVNAA
jgi:hypothetical protein